MSAPLSVFDSLTPEQRARVSSRHLAKIAVDLAQSVGVATSCEPAIRIVYQQDAQALARILRKELDELDALLAPTPPVPFVAAGDAAQSFVDRLAVRREGSA